jgi:hypothetical protein
MGQHDVGQAGFVAEHVLGFGERRVHVGHAAAIGLVAGDAHVFVHHRAAGEGGCEGRVGRSFGLGLGSGAVLRLQRQRAENQRSSQNNLLAHYDFLAGYTMR